MFNDEGLGQAMRMSAVEDDIRALKKTNAALREELRESDHIRERCAELLARTAIALKGPEKALQRHGWHDLPEVAERWRNALNRIAESTGSDDPCRPLVQIARDALAHNEQGQRQDAAGGLSD